MSSEWKKLRLGDLVSIKGGLSYKGEFVGIGDAILVGMGAVSNSERFLFSGFRVYGGEFSETHRLLPGDIVIATRQQSDNLPILGFPAIIPSSLEGRDVIVATNLYKVTNHSDIDNRFLFWLLRGSEYRRRILSCAKGTTVRMLTKEAIEDFWFACPPIEDRQGISDFLDALEDRITLLRETNATLEAIAQGLFKSWFVDFDPVRAKMEGRVPEGMDEATAELFPDGLEESKLGILPTGWRNGLVSELGEVICGKTPSTIEAANYGDEVPFITIPDMHGRLVVTSTNRSLSRLGADSQHKKYLPIGAICVSCIATPGLVVRVTAEAQTNQQINSVVPSASWGKSFPLFLLRRIGDAVRAGGSGGSVFHNLSKSGFEALSVLLPSHNLARRFDEVAEPLIAKIVENQCQVQTLANLRDTLLPRLISGQLRLHDVEAQIEAIAA